MGLTTAGVKQQAPQEGRGVASDGRDVRAATAAVRRSPRAMDRGPLVPTPLGSGAGACFQNSRRAVHN